MNPALLTTTDAVDPVFKFIIWACVLLLGGITATVIWFAVRYRRSCAPEPTSQVENNFWLETIWIVLPSILVLAMFYYGWAGYLTLRTVPKAALPVTATARMWSWSFSYANGKTSPKLVVPVGKPVVMNLVSSDIIHGFFLPAFRVKRDVVPGMKNHVWFVADKVGSYDLFCSQYCGKGHSAMITTVEAVPEAEFAAWLEHKEAAGGVKKSDGARLAKEKGCLACHSLDGSRGVGPTFKGLYHKQTTVLQNGRKLTMTVDDAYIRESIRFPNAKIVEGFQPIMPSIGDLKDVEVDTLVEFIKEVK
ncbi:MAG: cytochrome c oxidase subunit II [Geobacteraceae bacterium]|nr:cytochrome c oxidase subunit II [Geobacteraceae bacterium]